MLFKKSIDIDLAEKIIKRNKIPILINYEPWKKLFFVGFTKDMENISKEISENINRKKELERELSKLQAQKPKIMARIIFISNELNENQNEIAEIELDSLKKEIEEINNNIELIFEELELMPKIIQEKNLELLKETVKYSYENMNSGESRLNEIDNLVKELREELDKLRGEKEELDKRVNHIYYFLHSLLGYEEMEKLDNKLLK